MSCDVKKYARVVVNIPVNKVFHYSIPEEIRDRIDVGSLVNVPFGRRYLTGYCVGFAGKSDVQNIKDIKSVTDKNISVDDGMLRITKWISDYYCCSWGEALDAVMPVGVKNSLTAKPVKFAKLVEDASGAEDEIDRIAKKSPAQARILRALTEINNELSVKDLLSIAKANRSSLSKLEERNLVVIRTFSSSSSETKENKHVILKDVARPDLSDEQQKAVDVIDTKLKEHSFNVILLQGVTGSGKTEVYLRAIELAVSLGLCSIVLVPEIALTPQTIRYFKTRFENVAVMHSNLLESDRKQQWQSIKNGKVNVVVGTRSAIFAPVKRLGVVIVDEEHEGTFKQENSPRYNGRDVGIMRAMYNDALVILGSATPSLESYYNAVREKYTHVLMKKRIGKMVVPRVDIVDMAKEASQTKRFCYISRHLERSMRKALLEDGQIILFLNRRGFAPFINCRKCGFVLKCKNCDITLTYHKITNNMVCHYCYREQPAPKDCPDCAMPDIKYQGFGTERVEEEIKRKFPDQIVLRMDSDTMKKRGSHEKAFAEFENGKANILLGTQMIAKGLDFANVTLVGVISADTTLNIPDFRSSERTFQLLAQVSGRAGRGVKEGLVIIQAFNTKHYSIQHALKTDYEGFAMEELSFRKQLNYPPYGRIIRILFMGKVEENVKERAKVLTNKLKCYGREKGLTVDILGPAQASVSRIKNKFRWHTILKAPKSCPIHSIIDYISSDLPLSGGVQSIVDVDPGYML